MVESIFNALAKPSADFRLVAVTDSFEEEILEPDALKDFAKNVEHTTVKRIAFDPKFFKKPEIDITFTSFVGDKVP